MNRRGFGLFLLIVLAFAIAAASYGWNNRKQRDAARESRRADYAQCIATNTERRDVRLLATANYNVLADRLRYDPPTHPKLRRAWKKSLVLYGKVLDAQRPLDCVTYVRADLPPDRGD